jgi:hypothetical protein
MSMKLTKRKGFNFFRSYFDVYNELTDKEKVMFIDALLDRQFLGVKPKNLTGMAKFAYISQTNSIDSQVKGFEDKTGISLTPTVPPTDGGSVPPSVQVEGKEKGEVEEKGKVEVENLVFPFDSKDFMSVWDVLTKEKKWRKKSVSALQASLEQLSKYPEQTAIQMMKNTIAGEWQGLFELKQQQNGTGFHKKQQQTDELIISHAKRWGSNPPQAREV